MYRRTCGILLLLASLSFLSCNSGKSLFIADEFWMILHGPEEKIQRAFRRADYPVEIRVVDLETGKEDLIDIIESFSGEAILLSPLISGYTGFLASRFPNMSFIAYGDWSEENVCSLIPERTGAMEDVGRLCAEWTAGFPGNDHTAAAVFLTGSERRDREYEAFMDGWNGVNPDCELEVKRMKPGDGKEEMDMFLSLELLHSICLGIFFTGSLNGPGIEYCAGLSIPVVTEYGGDLHAYNADVLIVLEESYTAALIEALDSRSLGGDCHEPIGIPVFPVGEGLQ